MNSTSRSPQPPSAATWAFCETRVAPPPAVREAIDEATAAGHVPPSEGVLALLATLTRAVRAKAVVEIGTYMGASGLTFLSSMAHDGVLTSIDAEADNQYAARRLFLKAGLPSSRFRLIAGSPLDIMPKLRDGAYDLVFINGDKTSYVEYVISADRMLREGGMLVLHDALWHGDVADEDNEGDEALIIREAIDAIAQNEAYDYSLLPVGNGLLLAVKHTL
ncbi:MAG TPA: O-methyltransferase [Arachnia sp.]|nr:O-methyltransferase [Arachnia sp.]HMT85220.1 O-methyltransferase [Arachnia sp.]